MKTGLESLDTGASDITYSGNEGPKSPQQIAEADFMLLEEYQKYVFEMEEQGLEPISLEEFRQQAVAGMATGGRAGYASGQLVKPGPGRPGYRGQGAGDPRDFDDPKDEDKGPLSQDIREQASVASTMGRTAPTVQEVRELVSKGPDDDTNPDQNMVQMLATSGYTPKEIRRMTGTPNFMQRQLSRLNNPLTRGVLRTGLYTLNPTLGPLEFRKMMKLKDLYDVTKEGVYGDADEEDVTMGFSKGGPARVGFFSGMRAQEQKEKNREQNRAANYQRSQTFDVKPKTVSAPVGGGADMATVSAKQLGISNDTSVNKLLVAAANEAQRKEDIINQKIASSVLGQQQAKNQFINMKSTPKKTGITSIDTATKFLNAILPQKRTREFYYDNVIGRTITLPDGTKITFDEDNYNEYDRLRKAGTIGAYGTTEMGQDTISGRGGGGQQQIAGIPSMAPTTTAMAPTTTAMATTPTADDFVFNFAQPGRKLTEEELGRVSVIGAADGGRIGYAGGGIADLRQGYFLGKLVKKAARGIKKVAKSPLGRAALLYAGGTYLGGLKGLSGAKTNMSFLDSLRTPSNLQNLFNIKNLIPTGEGEDGNFTGKIFDKLLRTKLKGGTYSGFDPFKIGILGASALTGLYAKKQQDDEVSLDEYMRTASRGAGMDPRSIREYIAANKGNINPIDYAFLNPAYYQTAADGGRIGLAEGLTPRQAALKALPEYKTYNEDDEEEFSLGGSAGLPPVTQETEGLYSQSFSDDETPMPTQPDQMPRPKPMMNPMMARQMNPMMGRQMNPMMGGRMMAQEGGIMMASAPDPMDEINTMRENIAREFFGRPLKDLTDEEIIQIDEMMDEMDPYGSKPMPRPDRVMAQEGGLMDMGGMEKDYRNEGGFVPIGGQERADDVPARLSKNEFVFTADAVRNAGGGDIDKGAEIMENMMENLEAGGKVSEGSQGLEGAREMFATQQRLGEVL